MAPKRFSASAPFSDNVPALYDEHIGLLDRHIRNLRTLEIDINKRVGRGTIDRKIAAAQIDTLRPMADRAVDALSRAKAERDIVCPAKRTRSADKFPEFNGIPGSGQALKKRKISSPEAAEHSPLSTADNKSNAQHATTVEEHQDTEVEEEDITAAVEARLNLNRERRARRIEAPESLSPEKEDGPLEKRKRSSLDTLSSAEASLRHSSNTGKVSRRDAKRLKHKRESMDALERAESLHQRSQKFFQVAADVENRRLDKSGRKNKFRHGTRGERMTQLREAAAPLLGLSSRSSRHDVQGLVSPSH